MLNDRELSELQSLLANTLRTHRIAAGLTGTELGRRAGMSQSKISKLEHGHLMASEDDVVALAAVLGLHVETTENLLAQARRLASGSEAHMRLLEQRRDKRQESALLHEDNCRLLEAAISVCMPALVQTLEYSEAVLHTTREMSEEELRKQLALRMKRFANVFDGTRAVRLLIHGNVLATVYKSLDVLRRQIAMLHWWARRPEIELGIIRADVPQARMMHAAFSMFDRRMVRVELLGGDVTFQSKSEVAPYIRLYDQLWNAALTGDELVAYLDKIVNIDDSDDHLVSRIELPISYT